MDTGNIVVQTVITGIIQAVIGLAFYKLIERQDRKIDGMRARIQDLEDKKLEAIKERLNSGSEEFDGLHNDLKQTVGRGDYLLHQERCEQKFGEMKREQERLQNTLSTISNEVAGVGSIVRLIASRLNISLP